MRVRRTLIVVAMASALGLAACGGKSADGARHASAASATSDPLAAPTLEQASAAKGEVTVCAPKDTAGDQHDLIASFNRRMGAQGLHARLTEFPTSADAQHAQIVQRQEAKSSDCDVYKADTVFIAEFVA